MFNPPPRYRGYRFPPTIISHAVWPYDRFGLSFRDVEDLFAERGIAVAYEAIRLWCLASGSTMRGGCDAAGARWATSGNWTKCS
jgi:transposase-like protein